VIHYRESVSILFKTPVDLTLSSPYHEKFDSSLETPMSWWLSIKDKYKYLSELALMMFSITPHSAGCERVFSTLGWLYGKRRQRLELSKVESMALVNNIQKIRCMK